MSTTLTYQYVKNFICPRCGCTQYDKMIYTGFKTLDEEDSIILENYVCRNCDYVIDINKYLKENSISIDKTELLNTSNFVDEGTEIHAKVNNETKIYKSKGD